MENSLSILFNPKPQTWGLRGDPFLWDELEHYFATVPLPCSKSQFVDLFEDQFQRLTNEQFKGNRNDAIFVEKLSHGGMSNGQISIPFWEQEGLPLLLHRLEKVNAHSIHE